MAKQTLPVVLVGCGGMANTWLRSITEFPDIKLVGLVDIRREAAEAMAAKYNFPATIVYDTLTQAIKAAKPRAVFDVTIPDAHDKVVIEALKAGCDVLGEKPMASSLEKAKKMVATAKKARRTYAVLQNYRYRAPIRAVQGFLQLGKLGGIEEIHADFFIGAHFGGFRDQMDYPLILDMAIHTFDAARFLSGADPVAVYCHSFNPKRSWYKSDASAAVIFEMSNGIVFNYRGSWCAEGLRTDWNTDWRIVCNRGSLKWDGAQAITTQVVASKDGFIREYKELPVTIKPMKHEGHPALMREFVQSLKTGKKPMTTCEDNIKSLAMVFAALESAKTGKRMKVRF